MENQKLFEITVIMPSGTLAVLRLMATTKFSAIDLLYYRDGYHKRQPDRAQYVATEVKK